VANADGILDGWLPDVHLDETGRTQSEEAARHLAEVRLRAMVTSPMERCRETAQFVAARKRKDLPIHTEVDLAECRYGEWSGMSVEVLRKEPLWEVVDRHPSAARFPGGESLGDMQARAVRAIRKWNRRLGENAAYVAVTHGDVIKAIIADALGLHLDLFQRLQIDPGSVSVIRYTQTRPQVACVNITGGDLSRFSPGRRRKNTGDDAPLSRRSS